MSEADHISIAEARMLAKLTYQEEFISEYQRQLPETQTREEAYHAVEKQHEKLFGRRKYSSFHCFANLYYRKLKNQRTERLELINKLKNNEETKIKNTSND